tara:strand:+ start:552 stop:911 length:360 start_codon:yes stop_codon:yes gene_type:complete
MMARHTVTMMVEEDVWNILKEKKKRAGVSGTRGTYIDRAVRYYEEQLSYDDEIREANKAAHSLRTVAREMHIRAQNVAHLLNAAMAQLHDAGLEFKHPGPAPTDQWLLAQSELFPEDSE